MDIKVKLFAKRISYNQRYLFTITLESKLKKKSTVSKSNYLSFSQIIVNIITLHNISLFNHFVQLKSSQLLTKCFYNT